VLVDHPTLGAYFDATLVAKRCMSGAGARARSERAGLRTLLRYGFGPQRVAALIYWQAGVLFAKGCPVCPKPDDAAFQPRLRGEGGGGGGGGGGAGCATSRQLRQYVWRPALAWPWTQR
jgi:hypothetical protein